MEYKITINKKSVLFFALICCITSFFGTNYLFSNIYTYDFMVLSSLFISIFAFFLFGIKITKSYYRYANIIVCVMWVAGIIKASVFNLPISVILKESCYTIVPLLVYFSYKPLFVSKKDLVSFLRFLLIAGLMCNAVSIIEMCFALHNVDVLNLNVFAKLRNGTPRFAIGETVVITSFLLSCCFVLDKDVAIKKKLIHYINICLTVINLVWIIKTRSLDLYLLATLVMIPVLNNRIKKSVRIVFGFAVIVILLTILFSDFVPLLNSFVDSDYGIQIRFSMISYYLNYFKNHWLFGAGFISANPLYTTHAIVSGPFGRYYVSDVGVIGLMFTHGVIGLIWLIMWFVEGFKLIIRSKESVPTYYNLFTKLLWFFLLFSCINLILTNTPRIPYIVIGMLLFEYGHLFSEPNSNDNGRLRYN